MSIKFYITEEFDYEYNSRPKGSIINNPAIETTIIHHYLANWSPVIKDRHRHYGIIEMRDLFNLPLQLWSGNRPRENDRCIEIAQLLNQKRPPIADLNNIILSFNNVTENFEIIDGSHRVGAFKYIKDNYDYSPKIFVSIGFDESDGDKIDLFLNINKSIPVSELYTRNPSQDRTNILEPYSHKFREQFPQYFTTSNSAQKPNTTRDLFQSLLIAIYEKYNIESETELNEIVQRTNQLVKNAVKNDSKIIADGWRMPRRTPAYKNQIVKCAQYGLYLFMCSIEDLKNNI